jgi:DNA-binding NarL/FixJ family response regulator
MAPIRVLVVDDHRIMRLGLRALLETEDDIEIVGEASDGREAIEKARALAPDVIVMDLQLPGLAGIEATRSIRQINPGIEVLALTMYEDEHHVVETLRAGARSYLLKESAGTDLVGAIRATHAGRSVLDPSVASLVVNAMRDPGTRRADSDALSARERNIFALIASGRTSREIGEELGLSAKTIDNYRAAIARKLDARNWAEAVAHGIKRGLLAPT